jgi:hypothetical protein
MAGKSSGRGGGAPGKGNPGGDRGGNRGGGKDERDQPKRSSQAAGKDPKRGERERDEE